METKQIKCPQCKKLTVYSPENKFRPFCSERCRLIDLGEWASGSYAVATDEKISIQELTSDSGNDSENQ